MTGYIGLAAGGPADPDQDLHSRGFTGSVCAEETEYFSLFHLKADGVHRGEAAELFGQVLDGDYVFHGGHNTVARFSSAASSVKESAMPGWICVTSASG